MKQSGFITKYPEPQDWKMGAETGISLIRNIPDWTPHLPSKEKQYNANFDTLSCTTFATMSILEAQLNWLLTSSNMPIESSKWLKESGYIDEAGKVNFSDRFIAIMSNTTKTGNDFRTVIEAIRTHGLIPEKEFPFGGTKWEEYHDKSLITGAMLKKAQEFKNLFNVNWDWLWFDEKGGFNEMSISKQNITTAPILMGITTPATHATVLYGVTDTDFMVFDTYEPFLFAGSPNNYNPQIGARVVITPKEVIKKIEVTEIDFFFSKNLFMGNRNNDVKMLQRFLISQGILPAGLDTGYFYSKTLQAVKTFQMRNGIPPTGNVAEKTRAKINQIITDSKKKIYSISKAGFELIKQWEGLGDGNKQTSILEPYQDITGTWTIGYGNTYISNVKVTKDTKPITIEQAEDLLKTSIKIYEQRVIDELKTEVTQNQFDALVSFCFNLGNIKGLKDKVNNGTLQREDFYKYVYSKGIFIQGLMNRRIAEANYYFNS